ncbi:MAG: GNAT family N-acetyltransferase [Bacilli bacterium]|nr:GNAT family N-acetyltransferase [Bacilli bacterium]
MHNCYMINKCYKEQNISVNENDILKWFNHPTYNSRLWIKIEKSGLIIASGIAEYDSKINEGILEWLQVLSKYQNKGFGKIIINSLLIELKNLGSKFTTVSGDLDNNTKPEKLYRSCGFSGDDI